MTGYSPPFGPLAVRGEAELRQHFRDMRREVAQRMAGEADDGYAPGAPDTLGRFAAEVRDPITGVLEVGAACKITRQDDGTCLVTETARDQRREDGWMRAVDRGEDRLADARQGCRRAGR